MKAIGINASPRKNANTQTLGVKSFEFFYQYGAELDRKSARNDPELLEKATTLGNRLV